MFTGIIEAQGKVTKIENNQGDWKVTFDVAHLDMSEVQLGDSIAANGVCLTVIDFGSDFYTADVSGETLQVTSVGNWQVGTPINFEKALTLQDKLGGHLVSGHVDGIGEVSAIAQDARSWQYEIKVPHNIKQYIAAKGSICIDGISLTVNYVKDDVFGVNIVPHTYEQTTMSALKTGSKVNLEVDLLARYIERMLNVTSSAQHAPITQKFLAENGFK